MQTHKPNFRVFSLGKSCSQQMSQRLVCCPHRGFEPFASDPWSGFLALSLLKIQSDGLLPTGREFFRNTKKGWPHWLALLNFVSLCVVLLLSFGARQRDPLLILLSSCPLLICVVLFISSLSSSRPLDLFILLSCSSSLRCCAKQGTTVLADEPV